MTDAPDDRDRPRPRRVIGLKVTGHTILGAILLGLGVLWTLDNLNLGIDSDRVIQFWPLGLVAFGVAKCRGYNTRRDTAAGTVMLVIGGLLLLRPLGLIQTNIFHLWPLLLIAGGLSLLKRSRTPVREVDGSWAREVQDDPAVPDDSHVSLLALMGSAERRVHSQAFRGAEATAMMGGVELDLRYARGAADKVYVDVFTWWGGIEIIVPRDWKVDVEASPIMGGVVDTSLPPLGPAVTTLVVRGIVIMGGVEVKNRSGRHPDAEPSA